MEEEVSHLAWPSARGGFKTYPHSNDTTIKWREMREHLAPEFCAATFNRSTLELPPPPPRSPDCDRRVGNRSRRYRYCIIDQAPHTPGGPDPRATAQGTRGGSRRMQSRLHIFRQAWCEL